MSKFIAPLVWVAFSSVLGWGLSVSFFSESEETLIPRTSFLPGPTTHGHYQIELKCNACHDAWMGVREDSCTDCHADELKRSQDTHPKSKFASPARAKLLEKIDATSCIACHREHVPEHTGAMGLSLPQDYCIHCHEDVGDDRPSHAGFAHDTCASAGCHNYHDNRALFESFLNDHHGEPDHLGSALVAVCPEQTGSSKRLFRPDADAPDAAMADAELMTDWAETRHAFAGVNCSDCHTPKDETGTRQPWSDAVAMSVCNACHDDQVDGFLESRHGMRIASDLSPMRPELARLPMHASAGHRELSCNSCHPAHRYDRETAAYSSCVKCHDDEHTNNYTGSAHHELWKSELAGDADPGSGVSCATCHLPRIEKRDGSVHVEHNQNLTLRPNEKMIRSVCMNCHGLEFSLSALADADLIRSNFTGSPKSRTSSVQMAHDWFEAKRKKREARLKKRQGSADASERPADESDSPDKTDSPKSSALAPLRAPRPSRHDTSR